MGLQIGATNVLAVYWIRRLPAGAIIMVRLCHATVHCTIKCENEITSPRIPILEPCFTSSVRAIAK